MCTRAHPNKYFFKISYYLSFHLPKLVLQYLFSPLWLDLTFRVISNMVKTHFLCLPLPVLTFSLDFALVPRLFVLVLLIFSKASNLSSKHNWAPFQFNWWVCLVKQNKKQNKVQIYFPTKKKKKRKILLFKQN